MKTESNNQQQDDILQRLVDNKKRIIAERFKNKVKSNDKTINCELPARPTT